MFHLLIYLFIHILFFIDNLVRDITRKETNAKLFASFYEHVLIYRNRVGVF